MNKNIVIIFFLTSVLFISCINESSFECNADFNLDVDSTQLAKDINIIDSYLADSSIVAIEDPTGLRYVINKQGSGFAPSLCNVVTVDYEAILMSDGEVVDRSLTPATFNLSALITGWKIGLPKITTGGVITLYVPSVYAYGSSRVQNIPPNSNLIFEINLLDVN
ncbi:MAG: FKBP-type peptidyl-prolyl cis-trans isomerase [Balneola sp.]|nr:FKBP-type peptidyl-prolyl cis-trans isomerase [Balneola sp.]MBO6651038.1 FKBP-type peptidyl-prolyl cis-trans isomerase [Balneola sp.]MBO6712834.1 FKBP-type peptidyl-prolyl cis-trans isomerase [Balneola sp.]MBO6801133.1 FKBP-type peptidyl-prolyl cis-trans isomerase [Balneola sp.]MBO6871325.1 FKBP-type peptidyl-prolyl cis-trans isomerase [Balneola sp.]